MTQTQVGMELRLKQDDAGCVAANVNALCLCWGGNEAAGDLAGVPVGSLLLDTTATLKTFCSGPYTLCMIRIQCP
jgi:hypothetical protein